MVVILVALAAIAIPIFLNQKSKADNASAQTLTSNLANAVSQGIGTGNITVSTPDGTAASTGNIVNEAGTQAIPANADVWVNTTSGAFCVSVDSASGTTYKYTSAAPDVVTGAACTSTAG